MCIYRTPVGESEVDSQDVLEREWDLAAVQLFGSRFLPAKRIRVEMGQDFPEADSGTIDLQLEEINGRSLGIGVPQGSPWEVGREDVFAHLPNFGPQGGLRGGRIFWQSPAATLALFQYTHEFACSWLVQESF
jgi:hypothetical protein